MLPSKPFSLSKSYTSALMMILIVLAVLLNLSHFIDINAPLPFLGAPSTDETLPDTDIRQFSMTVFDTEGRIKYTLDAPQLFHYAHKETTTLTEPNIYLYQPNKSPWHITAQQGLIQESDEIILQENVLIEGNQTKNAANLSIRTSDLVLHTTEKWAKTNSKVNIQSERNQLQAVGLEADLLRNTLLLSSQVEGSYQQQ